MKQINKMVGKIIDKKKVNNFPNKVAHNIVGGYKINANESLKGRSVRMGEEDD
jgi:hypothetical protein